MAFFEVKLSRPDGAVPPPKPKAVKSPATDAKPVPELNTADRTVKSKKIVKAPEIPARSRPSVEIAKEFVELNLKTVIDIDNERKLTEEERRAIKTQQKRAKRHRHRKLKTFAAVVPFVMIAAGVALAWWNSSTQPVDATDTSTRQFEISKGASSSQVAEALQKAGFIRSALAYKIYARWTGNVVQAGTHTLSASYTLQEISAKLTLASTEEISVQIPPGLTLKQLRDVFKRNGFTDQEIDAAYSANYDNAILNRRPAGATLEGFIFPETYRIYSGDGLETLLQKAIDEFARVVAENNLEQGFADRGLTFYEGLTLASLVELEVPNSDDQKLVAGVFDNRLARGMLLQSDTTYRYAYANGLCDSNSPSCNSIFNTYINPGLPPAPIANVDARALISTANATASEYLYFVSGDDGITRFSKTLSEHEANVARYCHRLCSI